MVPNSMVGPNTQVIVIIFTSCSLFEHASISTLFCCSQIKLYNMSLLLEYMLLCEV